MIALNKKLQIEIPEQEYATISSIKSLTDYILEKKA
jgi:acyl carrier protein